MGRVARPLVDRHRCDRSAAGPRQRQPGQRPAPLPLSGRTRRRAPSGPACSSSARYQLPYPRWPRGRNGCPAARRSAGPGTRTTRRRSPWQPALPTARPLDRDFPSRFPCGPAARTQRARRDGSGRTDGPDSRKSSSTETGESATPGSAGSTGREARAGLPGAPRQRPWRVAGPFSGWPPGRLGLSSPAWFWYRFAVARLESRRGVGPRRAAQAPGPPDALAGVYRQCRGTARHWPVPSGAGSRRLWQSLRVVARNRSWWGW